MTGSLILHLGIGLLIWWTATQKPPAQPATYAVQLVAAPPPVAETKKQEIVAPPTPPPPPKVNPKPIPTKSKVIESRKVPPIIEKKEVEIAKESPPEKPVEGAKPNNGTDVDNLKVEGKVFPFPEYLRRLTNEILRRWVQPEGTGALEAEVSFTVNRDGSVENIKVIRRSRSYKFNLAAQGAIERAGNVDSAFGPLPKGWPADILQVAFVFTPRDRR